MSGPDRPDRPPPLRVAVVAPRFPPDIGGMEAYAAWVADLLHRTEGAESVVLTTRRGVRTRRETRDGVEVVRLGAWVNVSNTPVSPLWPWQLRRELRRLGVGVVDAHSPVPLFADCAVWAARGRVPVVLTYHAGSLVKGAERGLGRLVDRLLAAYERHVLPRVFEACAALVGVSPIARTATTGRAVLLPPGVDVVRFRPAGDSEAPGAGGRLLYVGRVERTSRWKGLHVLVDALPAVAAAHPDVRLEVVGTGDDVPALQERAARLGVAEAITWTGGLPPEDVARAHRRSDVLVLPSLTEAESFGMVLIEAMASGLPVVGSRVGGIPHVVRDGVDGVLVPPGDAAALAAALDDLLADPARARAMGARGREAAVERWSWEHVAAGTLALLHDVAAGEDTRAPHPR